jgi:hypothetical protein
VRCRISSRYFLLSVMSRLQRKALVPCFATTARRTLGRIAKMLVKPSHLNRNLASFHQQIDSMQKMFEAIPGYHKPIQDEVQTLGSVIVREVRFKHWFKFSEPDSRYVGISPANLFVLFLEILRTFSSAYYGEH